MAANRRTDDDDQLVNRSYYGDKEAFGSLYEKYLVDIYRYVFYRVVNEQEAEDITEMVFLQAWEALQHIHLDGFRFRPWIYRIAHNKVIDQYRLGHPTSPLEDHENLMDETDNPETAYQTTEAKRILARAIAKLDPNLQDVLIYRFILGFSHEETAEIMDRTGVNIRVLQHRALKKLREWYQGEGLGHG
jgi:RNA polymerase sigma-70 factor (ECF subfamily)